ncbi:hypothetical protein [Aquibaculum arenosum]|uniref:HK97 gp10 family phage protein n=1 Tax=Aquibaculum arenosum TaxID=3032591 RepID=A0ABT5YI55_9PROT|nr:hypothetical protein [Fodinicurvata sp. CAU 1616]MDF2094620.1 hypothetical protein [Fodinicurvata sp. CAU 1616]
MPILRTLLFEAARRAARNPRVRAEAGRVFRDEVQPRLQTAATKGKGAAGKFNEEWRGTSGEVNFRQDPARFAGRLAGRLRRRVSQKD